MALREAELREQVVDVMVKMGQRGLTLAIAEEVEEQAAVYWGALMIGGPQLLSGELMAVIAERFKTYGQTGSAE